MAKLSKLSWAIFLLGFGVQAQNLSNQTVASQYGLFQVQSSGGYSFNPASCQLSAGGRNFAAFSAGVPVKIVDPNPNFTEIVTPVAGAANDIECFISVTPAFVHYPPFYLTSGTGGLQEALNNSPSGSNTIVLDALWRQLIAPRSAATVISSVAGNASVGLVDVTTTPYTSYQWNGSAYTAQQSPLNAPSFSQTIFQPSGTSFNVNVLNGDPFADVFAGSDCGAKLSAALTSLGGNPGRVYMTPNCGTISTAVTLGTNQHLLVAAGSYAQAAPITVGAQASVECPPTADTSGTGLGSCLFTESSGANLASMFSLAGTNAALLNVTVNGNYSVNPSAGANIIVTGLRSRLDHVNTENAKTYGVLIGNGTTNAAAGTKISHLMAISNQSDGVNCQVTSDVHFGEQSEVENNLGNGLNLTNCGAFRISSSTDVSGNGLDGILISGSSTAPVSAYNAVITNVVFSQNGQNDIEIQGWDAAHGTYVSLENMISNNLCQGSKTHGQNQFDCIHIQDSGYNAINGNVIQDPFGSAYEYKTGIHIISVNGELSDTVTGNNIIVPQTPLTSVSNTVVCGNTLNAITPVCN